MSNSNAQSIQQVFGTLKANFNTIFNGLFFVIRPWIPFKMVTSFSDPSLIVEIRKIWAAFFRLDSILFSF